MAKNTTETVEEVVTEPEATAEVADFGIHILSAEGTILGHGYESVEAAQAHIDAHLPEVDCQIIG